LGQQSVSNFPQLFTVAATTASQTYCKNIFYKNVKNTAFIHNGDSLDGSKTDVGDIVNYHIA